MAAYETLYEFRMWFAVKNGRFPDEGEIWDAATELVVSKNTSDNKQSTPPCPSCGLPTSAQYYCMDEECSEYGKVGGVHL